MVLRYAGWAVLLLGCLAAAGIFLQGLQAVQKQNGLTTIGSGWPTYVLPSEDLKRSSRDAELYYGKTGVMLVEFWNWCLQPEPLALIVAGSSVLISLCCFHLSKRFRQLQR